jgi:hypothetical protein
MSEKSLVRENKLHNYLLVEGKDDEHVFYSLLNHHQIPERFEIRSAGSINKLLDRLEVELIQSDLGRLGIVVDADTDMEARWRSLRNRLIESGYSTVPLIPNPSGTIIEEEGRAVVGIWLMPDNKLPGMLENFVSFLIPPNDLLWPIADDVLQKVMAKERRFRQTYQIKAQVHTWLAWQEQPGTPLGLAITNRYFDANAPYAQQLMTWLRMLFATEQ